MAEPVFREYTSADIPALISLWINTFGDSSETVTCFYNVLPYIGSCFIAECDGELAGMASVLTDLTLNYGSTRTKCAYIYAVATESRFRGKGIGGTLSRMAADYGREHGSEIISTLPANDGLYSMYAKTVGLNDALRREKLSASPSPAGGTFPLRPASPEEYNRKRKELLADVSHISVSDRSIAFLKALCSENGGDIFISDHCCAAMYVIEDSVFFTELLCPDDEKAGLLSSGAALSKKKKAYCYLPSGTGERSIAYSGGPVYHNTVWNITLE